MSCIGIDVGYDTAGASSPYSTAPPLSTLPASPGCRACLPDSLSATRQSWQLRVAVASTCWPMRCPSGPLRELLRTRTRLVCGLCVPERHGSTLTLTPTRCMVGFTDKERKHGEAALSGVRTQPAP